MLKARIEILGTPFNGLGSPPDIENPADGLRQAKLVPALASKGHSVTDLGDLAGFRFQEIGDPETGIRDFKPIFIVQRHRPVAIRLTWNWTS